MKKFALFFAFLLLGTSGAFAQSSKYDVNDDGDVNITDVIELVNIILGKQHEAVDLGLPSGTKWASCNVGATKPEEYGGYYAWGETEEKEVYSTATYQYATGEDTDGDGWYENLQYKNLGSDISGTYCDVAHVKWGGKWVMPSANEVKELIDNCTSEWTTLNGVNGMKFTSNINGNSIFLPASGWRWGDTFYSVGSYGNYWLSTQDPSYSYGAYGISSYSEGAISGSSEKFIGQSVRPVVRN